MLATFAAVTVAGSAQAATTTYTTAAAFGAATTGVTTTNFEGAPVNSAIWILQSGSYTQDGLTLTQTTNNAFLVDPTLTNYYYNWGTGDIISTPASGTLTVTFATAVTAFALNLGAYYDDGLQSTPAGAPSTLYGRPINIGTAQGDFTVNTATTRDLTFFGVTSDTAFNSFTISGITPTLGASIVFDNLSKGSAVVAAVPEPASWAMMIAGFGLVGGAMRRRASKAAFAI
jgi:hypothetical protein